MINYFFNRCQLLVGKVENKMGWRRFIFQKEKEGKLMQAKKGRKVRVQRVDFSKLVAEGENNKRNKK